jgi:serine/threonine protein kinase
MKLILEHWRKFLAEEDTRYDKDGNVLPPLPPEHATAIEEAGVVLKRFLGEGKMGKVYEVENPKTGQRMAAKVVSKWTPQYYSESKNYNWILKNRDGLPDDVKEYVVDVYKLFESSNNKYLVILMELLKPAPKSVVNQIFGSTEYSPEKEERLLKDTTAVYEIILSILQKSSMLNAANQYMGVSQSDRKDAAKRILRAYLLDKEIPKPKTKNVDSFLELYELSGPQWQKLYDAIVIEMESLLGDVDRSVVWSAASDVEKDLHYYIKKQVIPMTYGAGRGHPLSGAGPGVSQAFPEIQGILNAMKKLSRAGFNPRDMHTENIMMRPDTNQLVITDVGLFQVTR